MRLLTTKQHLVDTYIELVGIKSGLVLPEDRLIKLLDKNFSLINRFPLLIEEPKEWWQLDNNEDFSIRAEELEANFILLMHSIGTIQNYHTIGYVIRQFIERNAVALNIDEFDFQAMRQECSRISFLITRPEGQEILAKEMKHIRGFRIFINEVEKRNILIRSLPTSRKWDGLLPLRDLFESEEVPHHTTPDQYFDQRFIDYLEAQPDDLQYMHWRQFEYLVGEYFQRNNYKVTITRARGDGGTDVLAERHSEVTGPDLIMIQCKRYSKTNTVSVDQVKSFWTTLSDSKATKGLIATTSRLEAGARTYCEARKYQLTYAENEQVLRWLHALATHKTK